MNARMVKPGTAPLATVLAFMLAACGGGGDADPGEGALADRPASTAVLAITDPAQGAEVKGPDVLIRLSLENARVVEATTTAIRPDEGHIHLTVEDRLVSMYEGLEQTITLDPGRYALQAEFVASDHIPFSPRVMATVIFTVT